jgi:hypothetical protein
MVTDIVLRNIENLLKQFPNHSTSISDAIDKLIIKSIDKTVEQCFLGQSVAQLEEIKSLINVMDEPTPPPQVVKKEVPIAVTPVTPTKQRSKR